jgi:methylmalonyl-CoA mutase, N-terminal domain
VERGETVVVGVNRFGDGALPPVIPTPDFTDLARAQVGRLQACKAKRDGAAVRRALAAVGEAAVGYEIAAGGSTRAPLMPPIIDAVRARATVGEISDVLRARWGEYRPA